MILLITANNSLVEEMQAACPPPASLIHLTSLTNLEPYLADLNGVEPGLLLLDIETRPADLTECRQVCDQKGLTKLPIMAIIAQAEDRQAALEAGADDYLLLPLIRSEVQTRLAAHWTCAFDSFSTLLEIIHSGGGGLSAQTVNKGLKTLTKIFQAEAAWLLFLEPDSQTIRLLGSYNLPDQFQPKLTLFGPNAQANLKTLWPEQTEPNQPYLPQIIPFSQLAQTNAPGPTEQYTCFSIPLSSEQRLNGLLNLAYPDPPAILPGTTQIQAQLGQNLGTLINLLYAQEKTQLHATENAFLVLIARMVSEHSDLRTALSSTLELTSPLLNASSGDIWLLSDDEQQLELVSALNRRLPQKPPTRRAKGQGLLGWVLEQGSPLHLNVPTDDPRFDPQVDQIDDMATYCLLAAPLRQQEKTIGVLAVYNKQSAAFSSQDRLLLEGVAALTASAIAKARLMQDLRTHTDQQRTLMEERERLYHQIFQSERLTTIGRLTASLSHEINNPMQAIQGALTLALEELDNTEALTEYLEMSFKESERVVQLIDRMRQVYRPQTELPQSVDLNDILREVIVISHKELTRQKVSLTVELAELPIVTAISNQLHLIFLNIILNISDAIGIAGGGELRLRSYAVDHMVGAEFSTDIADLAVANWERLKKSDFSSSTPAINLGLSMSYDIIMAHGGTLDMHQTDQGTICRIELPLSLPDFLPDPFSSPL